MIKHGIFIGQAPPEKNYAVPFERTRLYAWLGTIGYDQAIIQSIFEFEALVDKFPGKGSKAHHIPKPEEISCHISTLVEKITKDSIRIVVPIGKLATQYVLNQDEIELRTVIGRKIIASPFGRAPTKIIIPLPHPSGLSTWVYQHDNEMLLKAALQHIQDELRAF